MQNHVTTTRFCSRCKNDLPLEAFGNHNYCRACFKAYKADWNRKKKSQRGDSPTPQKPASKRNSQRLTDEQKAQRKDERRDAYYRERYGVGLVDIIYLDAKQEGLCACCGEPQQVEGKPLYVSYDAERSLIRGLICGHCATIIRARDILASTPDRWLQTETFLRISESPSISQD